MKFTPENKTIKTMFRSYPMMSIPNFQREYSWDNENIAGISITITLFL